MGHWSIGRKVIEDCSVGDQGKTVFPKITIRSMSFVHSFSNTPLLQHSNTPEKCSDINNPLSKGKPKPARLQNPKMMAEVFSSRRTSL
jgi:hypothetical protein